MKTQNYLYDMIYVIVDYGMGTKVLEKSKKLGIMGGTIFLAKGTVESAILKLLCINDERKEIVMMVTDADTSERVTKELNQIYKFEKPNHGILFTVRIESVIGSKSCLKSTIKTEKGGNNKMYQMITIIVNRGIAEQVMEKAKESGANGGTIIPARGSSVHETSKLFNMAIEPEKEVIITIVPENKVDEIISAINEDFHIDKEGKGIIFVQELNKVYGIY